jgi:hypothetical protein
MEASLVATAAASTKEMKSMADTSVCKNGEWCLLAEGRPGTTVFF